MVPVCAGCTCCAPTQCFVASQGHLAKENWLFLPHSHQLPIALQLGAVLGASPPSKLEYGSADHHSCCELVSVVSMPCPEGSIIYTWPYSPGFRPSFFPPLLQCSLSLLGRFDVDSSVGATHLMICLSLHYDQLWFSIVVSLCYKKLHSSVGIRTDI